MSGRRVAVALTASILLAAACAGSDETTTAATGEAQTTTTTPERSSTTSSSETDPQSSEADRPSSDPAPVPEFLSFTADDVRGGDAVDASTYAGSDMVLWFWAPW